LRRQTAKTRRETQAVSFGFAAKAVAGMYKRRLQKKTPMTIIAAAVRRPSITIALQHTPHRANGARVATPLAPMRRTHSALVAAPSVRPRLPPTSAAPAAKVESEEDTRALLKGMLPVVEQLYGTSSAYQIMARAFRVFDESTSSAILKECGAPAVIGACLSLGVALELGELEWDGIGRTVEVNWSSRKAPVFLPTCSSAPAEHEVTYLRHDAFGAVKRESDPTKFCRCEARKSNFCGCRCIWFSLAAPAAVAQCELRLLGVKPF